MSKPAVEGLITFLYYRNLDSAAIFYEDVMGFEKTFDQGWAKIYLVHGSAHIGLVDGTRGYHKPSEDKPVMITVVVESVDEWYEYFKDIGIKTLTEPRDNIDIGIRMFLLEDPEGYIIEIQKFL